MNYKIVTITILIWIIALVAAIPISVHAQDDDATTGVTETDAITVVTQISIAGLEPIQSLLAGGAAIPGNFDSYAASLWWAFLFGTLGGLVYELLRLHGNIELPHRYSDKDVPNEDEYKLAPYAVSHWAVDLGFLARMFVGGMAALAIMLVISPPDRVKLIASAVVAGSAGASIFDALRARLTATLAIAESAELRAKSKQLAVKVHEHGKLLRDLRDQVGQPVVEPQAAFGDGEGLEAPVPFDAKILDDLEYTLGEINGIRSSMDRPDR